MFFVRWFDLAKFLFPFSGYMTLPEPRKTGWFASTQRRKGSGSSKGIDRPFAASSHAPNTKILTVVPQADVVMVVVHSDEVIGTGRVSEQVHQDPVHVTLVQSSESPPESVGPLERKRKSKEEGKSSSKRSRCGGSAPLIPLLAGVFDPAFDVASRMDFRPSSCQQAVIEPLSEGELLGAAVELMTRGVMLAWTARDLGTDREGRDLLRELAEEQNASAALRRQVERLTKDREKCDEKQSKLKADLDESSLQLATANKLLEDAKLRENGLIEEARKLKLEDAKLAEQSRRLSQELLAADVEKEHLSAELVKANETLTNLDATVVIEHEEGFNKAMQQAAFLLKVNPVAVGFNLYQDVYGS